MTAVLSLLLGDRRREPELAPDQPGAALDGLRRWIAATREPPSCTCHEPPQQMRWHKDARRQAGGYYECPERVAEARRRRVRAD